ncbi:MAG TPA: ribonuclease III [Verrucomicrobiae bacterium]
MFDGPLLQTEIQYEFREPGLLRQALTHPSVAHEQGRMVQHNQRLEFLGDAVLGLVLTRELYDKFPNVSEGPLTKARAQMINRRTLAEQARQISLQNHLILSRGEEANSGRGRASAAADAFEALIGAVFLDGGFDAARGFVLRSFHRAFGELTVIPTLDNPKGELQEKLQVKSLDAPQYDIVRATGPDHDRDFECIVSHGGVELGRGLGKSKKAAESEAAIAALKKLRAGEGQDL